MRVSVYMIYILACLLAIGAAILSGIVLLDTFHSQQKATEDAQFNTGLGQVTSMQTMIATQMARVETTTDSNSRQLLMRFNNLSDADLGPLNSVRSLNGTIWNSWVPDEKAPNSLNGVGVTLLYTDPATGRMFDRTFWAYWDLYKSGEYVYAFAFGNVTDNMTYAYVTQWPNYSTPQLGAFMYEVNGTALSLSTYMENDFFNEALPWSTDDGNSYWYFTHLRSFHTRGMWVVVKAWDVGTNWLGMMQSVQTPGAELIAFDSRGYVMAATNKAELKRLDQCRGAIVNGGVASDCINSNARSYPVPEIRDVYNALYQPVWDNLTAGPMAPTSMELNLYGQRYRAMTATLFTKDLLRVIIVWYAPWAVIQGSTVALTALICILTLLSTFVLTLLGVFGVLRPLMALGRGMRAVAQTLKQGDGEAEAVVEQRRANLFREVDEIGKDFETIVVDFLGFSSANARDNKCAPKDIDKPFAVVFTDVQASTRLWGKDPVEMSRCMQAHHELIRGLIKEHRLYEVKTVGDSFIVTTTNAQDALRFALDVQTTFYNYDWDWEAADEHYQEATMAFIKADAEQEYHKLWNGLRVRIGIHYGFGDVTYDEVSKGYDYYGNVVNTAARIENVAHGGQIVVSQDLMDALAAPLDPTIGRAAKLGTYPLRGVVDPPVLVEVKPTRLRGRTYPPLRVEEYLDDALKLEASSDAHSHGYSSEGPGPSAGDPYARDLDGARRGSVFGSASRASERCVAQAAEDCARSHALVRSGLLPIETVAHQLQALYQILEALLKPLGPQQQSTVTKALTKGWGVAPPKSKAENHVSSMRLVQRLSETTKVLSHIAQRPPAAQRAVRHGSDALDWTDQLQLV
eukprot:EG_transcript_1836